MRINRHNKSIIRCVVFVVLSFGLAALVNADDGLVDRSFDADTWVLITTGSFCQGFNENRDIEILEGRIGLSYYFRKGLAVSFEFHSNVFQGSREYDSGKEDVDAFGAGILSMLRWHFLHKPQWSLYLDYGVGSIVTHPEFPPHGTQVNLTPQFGLGLTFRPGSRLHIVGGMRQFHISNGKGIVSSNPTFDGILGYAGIAYTF